MDETRGDEARPAPRPRKRRARRFLVAALLLGALAVVGFELFLRTQGYCVAPAIYYDAEIGYRCRPNQRRWMLDHNNVKSASLSTNALGFRGALPAAERSPGVPRVITLGDSFTFGLGVEQELMYPERLREHLEARGFERAEVLNLSFPGWNIKNALCAYQGIGARYSPDVVVLGFTLDDLRPQGHGIRYSELPVWRHAWRTAIGEYLQLRLVPRLPGYRIPGDPEMAPLRRGYARARDVIPREPDSELARPYLERAMGALAQLDRAVTEDGGRLVVACLPAGWQVASIRAAPRGAEQAAKRAEQTRMQATVGRRCAELGIPFLDPLDAMIEAESDPYGALDRGHPNALGYRLLAVSIGEWLLRERHLAPPAGPR